MNKFRDLYNQDLYRYGNEIDRYTKRWLWLYRKTQSTSNIILKKFLHILLLNHGAKHGIEIDYPVQIGAGLYIGHPYGITINDNVIVGENCSIHKGVTIGRENRGKRKGTPKIGNKVWIGIGATVVGAIEIGDDVLIAPNSYCNCDVPSHSIVLGNPCKIINRSDATIDYINNIVEGK